MASVRPGITDKPGNTATRSLGLPRSASEPGLLSGSKSLQTAGAGLLGGMNMTSTLYERMKEDGRLREGLPQIPPAGVSTVVPLADSVGRDLQPDIYYPLPATPHAQRKHRVMSQPLGEVHVHYGLRDQKLPSEGFAYGVPGVTGITTESTMKAGQKFGIAAYKASVAERIYESNRKEPLGRAYVRGHDIKMLPEGFGNKSGDPEDIKKVVFPADQPKDSEEIHQQYLKTHSNYHPGERVSRQYKWPPPTQDPFFRFGVSQSETKEGEGARMALKMDAEDDGTIKRTRMVKRVCEDFRHVEHPKFATRRHVRQGAGGPPVPVGHAFGIKSTSSDYTAESCIKGYYTLGEQLPDPDLGRSLKPGRRNVTTEERPFGVPSVRTDIPAPLPGRRSIANMRAYGDEPGCAALLNPQRFDSRGVADQDFLLRRPQEELRALVEASAETFGDLDFDAVWGRAVALFEDGFELVSLDAFLYIYSSIIDERVRQRVAGPSLCGSASAPALARVRA